MKLRFVFLAFDLQFIMMLYARGAAFQKLLHADASEWELENMNIMDEYIAQA
jgi:hypothetical protein